ncbi:hypothetical protein L1085_016230 [Streptomyces sp. MSC1_001]|jgi:hypothetical protein|uniref:hypothetical protein n=1 Tax=Streptomyces sp. MSC1_001 TaxID=2909263 RepID=UPI00202F23E1|nr:hypothetical protein [Streptomyces sp. MSC1_001]
MSTNQMALLDGESDVLTQAEAVRLMGVTRARFRGHLDRGELTPVDHLGTKNAARVARADVLRLMAQRGMEPASDVQSEREPQECRGCKVLRVELEAEREEKRQLRLALAQAQRMVNTVFPT